MVIGYKIKVNELTNTESNFLTKMQKGQNPPNWNCPHSKTSHLNMIVTASISPKKKKLSPQQWSKPGKNA